MDEIEYILNKGLEKVAAAEYEDALTKVASVHNVEPKELHDFLTKEADMGDIAKKGLDFLKDKADPKAVLDKIPQDKIKEKGKDFVKDVYDNSKTKDMVKNKATKVLDNFTGANKQSLLDRHGGKISAGLLGAGAAALGSKALKGKNNKDNKPRGYYAGGYH